MEYLKVADLRAHPQNDQFFDHISGEKWDLFLESINTSGIIEPLVITQDNVIVSGHQRKRACEELGITTVPCRVVEYDDKDGLTKEQQIVKDLIETNVRQRGDIGGSELKVVRRVDALCDVYGIKRRGNGRQPQVSDIVRTETDPKSVLDVCKIVGVDGASYYDNVRLAKLEPEFVDMLDSGQIPTKVAARIIAKLTPEQQRELLELIPEGTYVSAQAANEYVNRITALEDENSWYDESEGAASEQIDALTIKIQGLEEDNERLRERHQTVDAIKLQEDLDNYKQIAEKTIQAKQALIDNLQKNVSTDEEIEKKFVGMFVGLTSVVSGLSDIPVSALKLLGGESKLSIAEILEDAVVSLTDLLSVVKEGAIIE